MSGYLGQFELGSVSIHLQENYWIDKMLIYSVTVSVENEIAPDWLEWMKSSHLPEVMATGCFLKYQFHRLVEPIFEPDTVTYNVLYYVESQARLDAYRNEHSPRLRHHVFMRYGEKTTAVRSILDIIATGEA